MDNLEKRALTRLPNSSMVLNKFFTSLCIEFRSKPPADDAKLPSGSERVTSEHIFHQTTCLFRKDFDMDKIGSGSV
jgi:hypothetical protein